MFDGPKKKVKMPDSDKAYILSHYKTMTVPEMAKDMKRGAVTVYAWMKDLKLEPKGRIIHRDHPFKKMNRRLEAIVIESRIANTEKRKNG